MPASNSSLGSSSVPAVAGLVAERLLLDVASVNEVMVAAVVTAAGPGQSCGVTYRTRYGPVTVASSDARALAVDEVQYAGGHGPCLQAMRTGEPVVVPDLAVESRWGSYPRRALAAGIRSSMSFPLLIDGASVGAVNLYSTVVGPWDVDVEAAAIVAVELIDGVVRSVFAEAAALAADPNVSETVADPALNVAIGIIMGREECGPADAEARLQSQAQAQGVPLVKLAQQIIDDLRTGEAGPA